MDVEDAIVLDAVDIDKEPMCSGSGCSMINLVITEIGMIYEHNQYRFQYPSYPLFILTIQMITLLILP